MVLVCVCVFKNNKIRNTRTHKKTNKNGRLEAKLSHFFAISRIPVVVICSESVSGVGTGRSVSPWHCLASPCGIRMISGNLGLECGQTFCLTVRSERCRKSGETHAASSGGGGGKAGLRKEIKEKMTLQVVQFFTPATTTTTTLSIKHWQNVNALPIAAALIV